MTIKIRQNEFFSLLIQIVLFLLFGSIFWYVRNDELACTKWFNVLALLSFLNMCLLIYLNISRGLKVISPFNLFILLSFLYNCGQVWLISMNIELTPNSFTIDRYSNASIISTLLIFQLFIILINIGSIKINASGALNKKHTLSVLEQNTNKRSLFTVGVIIFSITAIILLYNDLRQIMLSLSLGAGNYADVYKIGRDNAVIYTAIYMFPVGVFLSMITAPTSQIEKAFAIYASIRSVIMMLIVGSRNAYIPMLLCIIVYYFMNMNDLRKKIQIKYLIIIAILLVGYSYISASRNFSSKFEIATFLTYMVNHNPIFDAVQELGSTQDDIILVYNNTPHVLNYAMGKSYLGALISFIPGLDSIFPQYNQYTDIGAICNSVFHKGESLGGSYFAEGYYNFSLWILLAAPIIGYFVKKLDTNYNKIFDSSNYFTSMATMYLFYTCQIYIRGQFNDIMYAIKILCISWLICFLFGKTYIEPKRVKEHLR